MSPSQTDPSTPDQGEVEVWLGQLGALLPAGTLKEAGPEERVALLDLARIAAHRSQRWAAPISTYLVGLAFASLPRAERLDRIRALVAQLDVERPAAPCRPCPRIGRAANRLR